MADLLHVRIVVPEAFRRRVAELVERIDARNVIVQPDAARRPSGDVVLLDVRRDALDDLLDQLQRLGVTEEGSISVFHPSLTMSGLADEAAAGDEAVVWDEVSARLHRLVHPTASYLAFFAAAAVIAAAGILYDSPILIVGAMVVGPEFGPLAATAFGAFALDRDLVRQGLWTLLAGTAVAVATGLVIGLLARGLDEVPLPYATDVRPLTEFITSPDLFTVLVAAVAAVAGMIALVNDQSGTLVGVLISVTTIPAIAEIGLGLAFGNFDEVRGAVAQLAVNVTCIVVVGVLTLLVLRRRDRRAAVPA